MAQETQPKERITRYAGLWMGAFLLLLLWVGYGHLVRGDRLLYSDYSDHLAHNLAGMEILYRARQRGEGIPLWRSDQMVGWPAMTQPQALYTYPLHLPFWWLPPATALGWVVWLHLLLAGGVFWLLGSVLRLGLWARCFMAVAGIFQFKLIMALYAGWIPLLPSLVCTPLLFVVVFDALQRPRFASALWMALVGALCLHCGHLQLFYYTVLLLLGYLIFCAVGWRQQKRWHEAGVVIGSLGLGAFLALLMAAYLLIPLAKEAGMTSRAALSYSHFLADHTLQPKHLWTLLFPEALGTPLRGSYPSTELWEDVAYFGLLPLCLALLGMALGLRRRFVGFLTLAFLLTLLILPADTPLLRFLYQYLPGFSLFRAPSRLLFLTSVVGIMLAGVGLDALGAWLQSKGKERFVTLLSVLLIGLIAAEGIYYAKRYLRTRPQSEILPKTELEAFLKKQPRYFRVAPLGRSTLNPGSAAFMGIEMITGYEPYNFRHFQAYFSILQTGQIRPRHGVVWTDLHGIQRPDLLDLLNVRHLLSPYPLPPAPSSPFQLLTRFEAHPRFSLYQGMDYKEIFLYLNPHTKERAHLPKEIVIAHNEAQMYQLMQSHLLRDLSILLCPPSSPPKYPPSSKPPKPQKIAFESHPASRPIRGQGDASPCGAWGRAPQSEVTKTPQQSGVTKTPQQSGVTKTPQQSGVTKTPHKVEILSWRGGVIRLRFHGEGGRIVRLSEIWHPGWFASVDGQEARLYRADGALMALWLPVGAKEITLRFLPMGWPWAIFLSVGGALLFVILLLIFLWRMRLVR